jgi:hypothetical protein
VADRGRKHEREVDPALAPARTAQERDPLEGPHLRHAVEAPATARPAQLTHLQRLAGNAAVRRTLTVQRVPKMGVNENDLATGVMDNLAAPTSATGAGFQLPDWKNAEYAPSTGSAATSTAGAGLGVISNVTGVGTKSAEVDRIRKKLATTTDPVAKRSLERQLKVAGGDLGQKVGGTLGSGTDLATGIVNVTSAGSTAATVMGGVTAGVALPLQVRAGVRDFMKAISQKKRVEALKKQSEDWEEPKKALEAKRQLVQERQVLHDALEETVVGLEKHKTGHRKDEYASAVAERDRVGAELAVARSEEAALTAKEAAMRDAVTKKGAAGEASLEDIRMYAQMKNERGIVKKVFSILSSTLGIGGSIALIVAAAAGGAALLATPFGWALAAAAAAIGIAVGIYKLVKWFQRRKGGNERKGYAERLLSLATQPNTQGVEARKLIFSLGAFGPLFDSSKTLAQQDLDLRQKLATAESDVKSKKQVVKLLMAKLAS